MRAAISSLVILILAIGAYFWFTPQKQYFHEQGKIFGTIYHFTYESSASLKEELEAELKQFDLSLSPFNKQSIITKVNQNDTTVVLDDWFITVLNKSFEISAKTENAFDITVAPLVNAWGFGFKKKEQITPELIDSLLQFVGIEKVKLVNGKVVKTDPRLILNCSAIAKGYACDVIGELLARRGCTNYMVDIGGENVCRGVNSKGQTWRTGISKPIEHYGVDRNSLQEVFAFSNGAVATSGNYRNFYYEGGKRYAHTIDPKTGYPIQHELLSATVFAKNCITADAYATAFMVLGLEKAMAIVEADPELEGYFIYTDGSDQYQTCYSKGLEDVIQK